MVAGGGCEAGRTGVGEGGGLGPGSDRGGRKGGGAGRGEGRAAAAGQADAAAGDDKGLGEYGLHEGVSGGGGMDPVAEHLRMLGDGGEIIEQRVTVLLCKRADGGVE